MRVGLCGYPGCGKTTVFSALAPGSAPNKDGVTYSNIDVPDARVDRLTKIFNPKKTTYARITFMDVGESGKAAKGAFSPQVIQHMRNADVLVHVVRVFDSPMLVEPFDPDRDVSLFADELLLLDMTVLEKRQTRFAKENKKGAEVEVTTKCLEHLENGLPLRTLELSEEQLATLSGIQLLSMKPMLTLYNLSEETWEDAQYASLRQQTEPEDNAVSLGICGSIEAEIATLEDPEDQAEFLEGLGLGEPARNPFIQAAYSLLDLISFLTSGPDECRAWPIRRGLNARQAAGKIHSDLQRGFIRSEVYRVDDLEQYGSEAELKKQGKLRVEGRDYIVKDGDVMHVRFNV